MKFDKSLPKATEIGFRPNFIPMDKDTAEAFAMAVFIEMDPKEAVKFEERNSTEELPVLSRIIAKRVEVFKLPIVLTDLGLIVAHGMTKNPGGAVIFLIDFLTYFNDKPMTVFNVKNIAEVYPWGFYDEKSRDDYIDNYLKPKKVLWSELY